ncbi:MAG TPA: Verru_Chthon cassette protein A, partial [Candidatus Methylacidiphilales bacterium]|nr:Verru_Chthon cassette protein A [Candidatus Methylacidiphilales bacterium]
MKRTNSLSSHSRVRVVRRASSLVVVLAALGLLLVITVAFLASVNTELQTSKIYANSSSLKLLTQSSVNLVVAQVRVATGNPALCWASQPGMIRTYDTNGAPAGFFKLYTDDAMQGTGKFDHTATANGVPANWYSQKGVYVDLNQPVSVKGDIVYPIMEGNSTNFTTYTSAIEGGSVKALGPLVSGQPAVSGFWVKNSTPVDAASPNQVPMPVKWLYVLQDGDYILPDSGTTSGVVTFVSSTKQPTATNPIIGRIAYWTDDDTCKVNINTASEGSFWDTPRTYTYDDYYLARNQPVSNEFQRYPGHPATVSLSAVFPQLAGVTGFPEAFYPVTPRTIAGGSQGGTVTNTSTTTAATPLLLRSDRLYASEDEFLFQPGMNSGNRQKNSAMNSIFASVLTPAAIRRAKFFITAHSQAPDVNVFNLPRVSMWPITLNKISGVQAMTAYDKLIAYCTTINDHLFYFQRKDPISNTVDLPPAGDVTGLGRNRMLLEYLRTLTSLPIPGFGLGSFAAKYPNGDRDQLLTEMFDYVRSTNLQDSTTGATPFTVAYDTTVSTSVTYKGGLGQVVPIVDTTININDTVDGKSKNPRGFGRYPTVHQAVFMFIGAGDSTVTATPVIAANKQRVQAAFIPVMFDPSQGLALSYPWYQLKISGLDSVQWSADGSNFFPAGFSSPVTLIRPFAKDKTASFSCSNFGGILDFRQFCYGKSALTGQDKYPAISLQTGTGAGKSDCPDMTTGGTFSFRAGTITIEVLALGSNGTTTTPVQTIRMQFPSGTFPVPNSQTDPTTAISSRLTSSGNYTMLSFLNATINGVTKTGRLNLDPSYMFVHNQDVIRGLVATPGDMRLLAARTEVPTDFYQPLAEPNVPATAAYANSSQTSRFSHMLRFGLSYPVYGAAGGRLFYNTLAPGTTYSRWNAQYLVYPFTHPTAPTTNHPLNDSTFLGGSLSHWNSKDNDVPTQTGLTGITRDWDNGFQNSRDGAYINKADEGDTGVNGGNGVAYFQMDYNVNTPPGDTFFSPNRMIPSAGMFGSLPSQVFANKPWQTLLFRPGPAGHPGLGVQTTPNTALPAAPPYTAPPDHLLMDLFNMPVVEPYAISTPLATAGRINMNHLIVPFTYINRDTGLRAAMKNMKVACIPNNKND